MFSLYIVADRGIFASDDQWLAALDEVAAACVQRPQVGLQVRIKSEPPERKLLLAQRAGAVISPHRVKALLNGSTSEASWAEFLGVHWPESLIPQCAMPLPLGLSAGASVHSPRAAKRASEAGAAFLVFGAIFDAGSKTAAGVGTEPLRRVVASTSLPVLAIGGITPDRVSECLSTGAAGVAVVTGILRARDPVAAVADYLTAIEDAQRHLATNGLTAPVNVS